MRSLTAIAEERPLLLKVPEAAHLLGLSPAKTWQEVWAGRLPSVRFGKSVRVPRAALLAFLEAETQTTSRS